ncbi:MAG: HepT-like ribonuclease domain-containing protein [Campylobacterota bacterium]|nr:HepT-like ribonuclease domain-containing protein [Campylobacterota bacterium]
MSERLIELFLADIIVAIAKIEETISGFENSDDLKHHYLSWDSVIREFEIIGEASKHLLKSDVLGGEYRAVVDFRNVLSHGYFGIEEDEVWGIVHTQLNSFKELIASKVKTIEAPLKQEILDAMIEENNYLDFVVKELELLKDIDE